MAPTTNYGELIEQALREESDWALPLAESLKGRIFFAAVMGHCLRAASESRKRGLLIEVHDWSSTDQVDLLAFGREISFALKSRKDVIEITRQNFAFSEVPTAQRIVSIGAPEDVRDVDDLAQSVVSAELKRLIRRP